MLSLREVQRSIYLDVQQYSFLFPFSMYITACSVFCPFLTGSMLVFYAVTVPKKLSCLHFRTTKDMHKFSSFTFFPVNAIYGSLTKC